MTVCNVWPGTGVDRKWISSLDDTSSRSTWVAKLATRHFLRPLHAFVVVSTSTSRFVLTFLVIVLLVIVIIIALRRDEQTPQISVR